MDRVKFCPECDEVLPWDVTACKACGAPVPEDQKAFDKVRAKKEKELAKLRREAATASKTPERPPRSPVLKTAAGYASPTRIAISVAVWCFVGGAAALGVGLYWAPPKPLAALAGWLLLAACNLAIFWVIIHSAVVAAIRVTRDE